MTFIMPLISAIVSLVFTLVVLDQFFARRKPHQLIWVIGLFLYFISTGIEFWTGAWGLNETAYRLWYLTGAILVAAYLGMGTIYLLVWRRVAHTIMVVLLVVSIYAVFRVFTLSLDMSAIHYLSSHPMPDGVRLMARVFSNFGAIALVGGAIYSALVYWRRRIMPHRVLSNILIAIGAIFPAVGGIGIGRLGWPLWLFYLLELLGIIIIFTGFLRNREVFGLARFPLIHGWGRIADD